MDNYVGAKTRLSVMMRAQEFRWAQGLAGRALSGELMTECLPHVLRLLSRNNETRAITELEGAQALAFCLTVLHDLKLIDSLEAFGGDRYSGQRYPANTNKPGGKCSNQRRPRSAPRRRKPRLKVIEG